MTDQPTIFNDGSDIARLNDLFDQLSSKPYLSPFVAVNAFRHALDLAGITLPILEIEQQIDGANQLAALKGLSAGVNPIDHPAYQPPQECEYAFKIIDADKQDDINNGVTEKEDWDNHLYLYICIEREDESGLYDAYAQVVDESEINTLLNMDIPEIEKDYPEMFGDTSGETEYLKQVRHSQRTVGFSGEKG